MRSTSTMLLASLLAVSWLSAGCAQQSQPSSFYVLSYEESTAPNGSVTTMRDGLSLGVGPVELPQYLDRPQIVTRASPNQLMIEEFDRWGGRLRENFTTVLVEILSAELGTDDIAAHPWNSPLQVDYQVIVDVTKFDTDDAGRTVLDARWRVVDVRRQSVLATARSTFRQDIATGTSEPSTAKNYDAIAAAMSRNVTAFGQEVAKQIRSLTAN